MKRTRRFVGEGALARLRVARRLMDVGELGMKAAVTGLVTGKLRLTAKG